MKNLLIAAIAVFTIGASAQDVNFKSKRGEYMLPEKGDWALGFSTDGIFEYLGNAFNGNTGNNAPTVGISNTTDNGFRGRFVGKYFTKDKAAYRVVFNLSVESNNTKLENTTPVPANVVTVPVTPVPNIVGSIFESDETQISNTEFSIGVGKEWRRGKTRLQGFYGADVLLFVSTGSSKVTNYEEVNLTSTTPAGTFKKIDDDTFESKSGVGVGFGVEGFIGAEYFLFPKIAIGAQYTYGARYIKQGAGENNTTIKNSTQDSLATPVLTSDVTTTNSNTSSNSKSGLTGVDVFSINLTLHF